MKKKRRNNRIPKMALTERDQAIILYVYQNRFLKRDQIQRIFFRDITLTAANMRLKKLYEHHLLDRLFKPVAVGSSQAVYALDKKGADIVAAVCEIECHKVNWKRDHNRVEFLFMEHTLAVSEFRVNLDLALLESPDITLAFYRRGDRSLAAKVSDPSGKKKYIVVSPDAFFGLQTPAGNSYFFLEVDMGTETLKRFSEKIIAYKQYWKSGKYRDTYGFNHFRVVTVAESERRLANLVKATIQAGGRSMFLFSTCSLVQKGTPLGDVWHSPVGDDYLSILSTSSGVRVPKRPGDLVS